MGWAGALQGYLLKACQASRQRPVEPDQQTCWRTDGEHLCQQGDAEEQPALVFFKADGSTGRSKRTKGRNLLERLMHHQESVLGFVFEAGVPFTNNQAEGDLRPAKVKQKVSNCFRTQVGAD